MADKLQHRLSNLEIEPPVSLWSAIEKELNEDASNSNIGNKLHDYEVTPPVGTWEKIEVALNEQIKEPAKLIHLNWKKIAVAASVIAITGTLAFIFFFNSPGNPEKGNATVSVVTPKRSNQAAVPKAPVTPIQDVAETTVSVNYLPSSSSVRKVRNDPKPPRILASNVVLHEDDNIEISAPPIRDQSGNTILDKALLVSDNSSYITVTSPNGEKTRISAKFLGYLDKLYHQKSQDDEWKARFENWKRIMLQEASLAPAPGNYMDLLELKDILIQQ